MEVPRQLAETGKPGTGMALYLPASVKQQKRGCWLRANQAPQSPGIITVSGIKGL